MNYFGRILSFLKPYKTGVIITVLLNLFTVVFSIVSITALIPVLNIIFDATPSQANPVPYTGIGDLTQQPQLSVVGSKIKPKGKRYPGAVFPIEDVVRARKSKN